MVGKKTGWCLFVMLLVGTVKAELHEFNLPDGRALKAEILGYNARLGMVELKREDGTPVKVKPSLFVDEDRHYINEWVSLEDFRDSRRMKVDLKERIVKKWREDSDTEQRSFKNVVYEVSLHNKSSLDFNGVKVEYRIYYDKERNNHKTGKVDTIPSVLSGSLDMKSIAASQAHSEVTKPVKLLKYSYNISDYYRIDGKDPESTQDDIRGIWLRLTMETPTGVRAVRDVFEPSSIEGKYKW